MTKLGPLPDDGEAPYLDAIKLLYILHMYTIIIQAETPPNIGKHMQERLPDCPLHTGEHTPDKAHVRRALGAITKEIVQIVSDTNTEHAQVSFPVSVESYDDYRKQHTNVFDRVMNLPAFAAAEGRFTEYVTSNTNTRYDKPILMQPFIPIGEYGLEPASRLLTGTIRALALAEASNEKICEVATRSLINERAVLHHTFQGHIHEDAEKGLAITTQQGIISTAQSIALLSAEKVAEKSWDELVNDLVERDKVTEFSRMIGPGLLPYLVTFGRYIKNPVAVNNNATYLTSQLHAETKINREGFRTVAESAQARLNEQALQLEEAHVSNNTKLFKELERAYSADHLTASGGTACPAANRQGEITQTARLILELTPTE